MNLQDQPSDQSNGRQDFQPGQTVSPNRAEGSATPMLPNPAAPQAATNPAPQAQEVAQPQPVAAAPAAPVEPIAASPPAAQPTEPALYQASDPEVAPTTPTPMDPQMQENGREIAWTAAEFIEHQKSPGWYLAMIGVALVIVVGVFLLTRDIFNTVICVIAAILFAVVASRPPREMQYVVDEHGVQVGRRFYPYGDFRSFSLLDEDQISSIVIMPLKRFMPPISLYFDPDDEELIGDLLAEHLPYDQRQHELTERLMRRIRF